MCKPGDKPLPDPATAGVMEALKAIYDQKVVPSEKRYLYSAFDTPPLRGQEFLGKPTILLLGQYSVGKTSMISYLLNGNYPGADIGPEPTTDIFAHVDYSEQKQTISGVSLASDNNYQFQSLSLFGDVFLNKMRATRFNAPLLKHISIIDTPGILTGDKQVESRGYDFAQVIKFLSNKVDCIFLLFDANKLDISDEYKQILEGGEDKIKIILNKADSVRPRELVHVRGALMWALGKIMKCAEVPKVYMGSFWPYWSEKNVLLRDAIMEDVDTVVKEILDLPNSYQHKRVNDVVRRARNLRIHSYVMDEIVRRKLFFKSTPTAPDSETVPHKLCSVYRYVASKRRIVMNDFPDPELFHEKAKKTEAKDWARIDGKLDKLLNSFIESDVSSIVNAALNMKRTTIDYKTPRKIPLPEDFNRLIKEKKLMHFVPQSSASESQRKSEKDKEKSEKKEEKLKEKQVSERSLSKKEPGSKSERKKNSRKSDKDWKSGRKRMVTSRRQEEGSEKNSKNEGRNSHVEKSGTNQEKEEVQRKEGEVAEVEPKKMEEGVECDAIFQKEGEDAFA